MGTAKEARKEVSKFKNFEGCMEYVKLVVYPLLDKNNQGSNGSQSAIKE
jgi:hypothetical protein